MRSGDRRSVDGGAEELGMRGMDSVMGRTPASGLVDVPLQCADQAIGSTGHKVPGDRDVGHNRGRVDSDGPTAARQQLDRSAR